MQSNYNLEERLFAYAARIIRLVERLPNTRASNHIAGQLRYRHKESDNTL